MGKLRVPSVIKSPPIRDANTDNHWRQDCFEETDTRPPYEHLSYQESAVVTEGIPAIESEIISEKRLNFSNVSIFGIIMKQNTRLLVDTGAAISVISDQFYKDVLRFDVSLRNSNSIDNIKTADGHTTPVIGFVQFIIAIGDQNYNCGAYVVPNLAYQVVLGRDFLHKNGAVINVPSETVTFTPDNTVAFAGDSNNLLVVDVCVASTYVIEGRCEAILPACLSKPIDHVVGLIDANETLITKYKLLAASTLSVPDNDYRVNFRLINPNNEPVLIHKGTPIGTFCTLSEADFISNFQNDPSVSALNNVTSDGVTSRFTCLPSPNLTMAENSRLNSLLEQYSDVFASSSTELGRTTIIKHEIHTGDARPIKQQPYRVSQSQKVEIEKQINTMLEQDVIRVSSSPWSSPVVLVKKKDGTTRFCVDYRKLNAVTRKDSYPLPRIDDALDALSGAKYFTTLDLQSGYHQVAMDTNSIDKTAFISHAGLYEYNVMSFGLTNAPPTFQRLMQRVLHGLDWKICLVYIDDVIVFSSTFEDHLVHLAAVFDRLRNANLKLKPSKCHFGRSSVNFLGFIVSAEGILPDSSKINAVKSFPVPRSVTEVRSFLGLCNYYRRFVKDFAKIASPLNRLTRKSVSFVWDESCLCAFQEMKARLCSPPILAYPNFSQPFHLYTDASQHAIGYILGQVIDHKETVISYGGRELNLAETRYSTTEREALAVVDGIKRYQPYLYGSKFYVHSDHGSLTWLMNVKDPTGRLARWALQLQHYDFEIIHRPGKQNAAADALSRRNYESSNSVHSAPIDAIHHDCPPAAPLHNLQRQDADLFDIISYLETANLPACDTKARSLLLSIDSYYLDENGILCHLWSPGKGKAQSLRSHVVIPASLRHDILTSCHDDATAGHLGPIKTYEKIRTRYYWHGMFKDIEHWCRTCIDCAMQKHPRNHHKAPLLPIPVDGPFDRLAMDILGPLPTTHDGNRYIIVFSDYYTRWPEAYALPSVEASRIAQLLVDKILARHSAPRTLLSDRGPNFLASVVKAVCDIMNTRRTLTTAYHPQTDGLVERFNATLCEGLSMYVSTHQNDWDRHLSLTLFAYRVAPHATTGESPFYLLYGREPRLPLDASLLLPDSNVSNSVAELRARIVKNLEESRQIVSSNTKLAQQRMKAQYDKNAAPVPFDVGMRVWVYTPKNRKGLSKKLAHNYHGPYRIVSQLSPVHFKLHTMDNRPVSVPVHANRMKLYYDPADRPVRVPILPEDTSDLSDVDLPPDSFDVNVPGSSCSSNTAKDNVADSPVSAEPSITRPEDTFTPAQIVPVHNTKPGGLT